MFVLKKKKSPTSVIWAAAGITLELLPLTEDVDAELVAETTVYSTEEGQPRVKRDTAAYAQGIGRHCIKGWTGVVDEKGKPVLCIPAAIDEFMLIEPAQDFVISKVKGLELHLAEQVGEGKNVSEPSADG